MSNIGEPVKWHHPSDPRPPYCVWCTFDGHTYKDCPDLSVRPYCDWWMENRTKCPNPGTEYTEDAWGAPLRYCKKHLPLADKQQTMDLP